MTKKYVVVNPPTLKYVDTSPTYPKLDPLDVAKALGATQLGERVESPMAGPITLFAVRQELYRRLTSTGGRPGLADADKVAKVPISETQWKRLEELTEAITAEGFSPSAGQVANVLLGFALDTLSTEAVKELAKAGVR